MGVHLVQILAHCVFRVRCSARSPPLELVVCLLESSWSSASIHFVLPALDPTRVSGSSRAHRREQETRDDGWCEEEGCSEGACKNSRTYLRTSLSALLRRQSKLTKATEADAANARIVCQKPSEFAWEAKGTPQFYFQLCVAK